jgi:hypothetical protein
MKVELDERDISLLLLSEKETPVNLDGYMVAMGKQDKDNYYIRNDQDFFFYNKEELVETLNSKRLILPSASYQILLIRYMFDNLR